MANICLLVEDNQLVYIRKLKSAGEIWNALKNLFERSNLSKKLFLLRKLYRMKLESNSTMQYFIKDTIEIVEKLTYLGEEIKDNHIVAILLCGLPEEYESLITALEAKPEIEKTLNYVKKESSTFNQGYCEEAMKSVNKKRQTIICHYCSKPGHIKKECFKFKADQRENQNKNRIKIIIHIFPQINCHVNKIFMINHPFVLML
ncbi:hypothetical protein LAZ67_14001855 [Cordylochernes scorpioides]|uniref:CCHC-type domain-containing protein n=1 Tax=Cordylochernes scorpioides TaxID=51811 RepID=A0ABY6L905_9ARAC|nr:hypothetical protein LAZ67_14001855 [Cordylochernes scorpioides]